MTNFNKVKCNGFFTAILVLFLSLVVLLSGCGGGGGDGGSGSSGSGGGTSSITYSGSTTEATVTASNAAAISTQAVQGAEIASTIAKADSTADTINSGYPLFLRLPKVLENALRKIDFSSGKVLTGTVQSGAGSEAGSCGGTSSYSLTYDDQTGNMSGSITFSNYCDGGTTVSGGIGFSGRLNLKTGDFITVAISFDTLTFKAGSIAGTIKGNINVDNSVSPLTISFDIYAKDNATNKVYWWNNYIIKITEGSNYEDVSLSGKFYYPDYGYVTLSTPKNLRIYNNNSTPSTGILLFTGKVGTAGGNTSACLTFLSTTTYKVQADTNGGGSYNWDSSVLYW